MSLTAMSLSNQDASYLAIYFQLCELFINNVIRVEDNDDLNDEVEEDEDEDEDDEPETENSRLQNFRGLLSDDQEFREELLELASLVPAGSDITATSLLEALNEKFKEHITPSVMKSGILCSYLAGYGEYGEQAGWMRSFC